MKTTNDTIPEKNNAESAIGEPRITSSNLPEHLKLLSDEVQQLPIEADRLAQLQQLPLTSFELNNNRSLYVACKAMHEDLCLAAHHHGERSPEYKTQLEFALKVIGRSLPRILDIAIRHLDHPSMMYYPKPFKLPDRVGGNDE